MGHIDKMGDFPPLNERRLMLRRSIQVIILIGMIYIATMSYSNKIQESSNNQDNTIQSTQHQSAKQTTTESTEPTPIIEPKQVTIQTKPLEKEPQTPYIDIPLSKDLQDYIFEQCNHDYELHFLTISVIKAESCFNPKSVSPDGHDIGLMQIRDCNISYLSKKLGAVDLYNPYDNVKCGIYMLSNLYEKWEYKNLALMAYNFGEEGARKLWRKGIYSSEYSRKVTEYYKNYVEEYGEEL